MAIKPISKEQFDALQPGNKPLERLLVDEHEWFADETGQMAGVVVFEQAEKDWGWVILGREAQQEFRVMQMVTRLPNKNEARLHLRDEMTRRELARTIRSPQAA